MKKSFEKNGHKLAATAGLTVFLGVNALASPAEARPTRSQTTTASLARKAISLARHSHAKPVNDGNGNGHIQFTKHMSNGDNASILVKAVVGRGGRLDARQPSEIDIALQRQVSTKAGDVTVNANSVGFTDPNNGWDVYASKQVRNGSPSMHDIIIKDLQTTTRVTERAGVGGSSTLSHQTPPVLDAPQAYDTYTRLLNRADDILLTIEQG